MTDPASARARGLASTRRRTTLASSPKARNPSHTLNVPSPSWSSISAASIQAESLRTHTTNISLVMVGSPFCVISVCQFRIWTEKFVISSACHCGERGANTATSRNAETALSGVRQHGLNSATIERSIPLSVRQAPSACPLKTPCLRAMPLHSGTRIDRLKGVFRKRSLPSVLPKVLQECQA